MEQEAFQSALASPSILRQVTQAASAVVVLDHPVGHLAAVVGLFLLLPI
jgi:hypothetical protein